MTSSDLEKQKVKGPILAHILSADLRLTNTFKFCKLTQVGEERGKPRPTQEAEDILKLLCRPSSP